MKVSLPLVLCRNHFDANCYFKHCLFFFILYLWMRFNWILANSMLPYYFDTAWNRRKLVSLIGKERCSLAPCRAFYPFPIISNKIGWISPIMKYLQIHVVSNTFICLKRHVLLISTKKKWRHCGESEKIEPTPKDVPSMM